MKIVPASKAFRSFQKARKFTRSLKLQREKEWRLYCKGELKGYAAKPSDIPTNPHRSYHDRGWQGYGDWLGTGRVASINRKYRPFRNARKFARSLELQSEKEWRLYCKGELKGYTAKPSDIPTNVHRSYQDRGWQGYADWLGN